MIKTFIFLCVQLMCTVMDSRFAYTGNGNLKGGSANLICQPISVSLALERALRRPSLDLSQCIFGQS